MTRFYPASQYFGFQNPYNNPEMRTYFPNGTLVAGLGNLPGGSNPNRSAAQPGTGPINNQTGRDYDPFEKGTQGPSDPISIPIEEYDEDNPGSESPTPESPTEDTKDGDRGYVDEQTAILREWMRRNGDPDLLRRQLEATEPYFLRVAERNQKMGLENLEAAGKAAFNYKYAPQMFMTAAASKAAYYPEMVRAASESYVGLNLANAAKPRMSGYYRGIV